MGQIRAAPFRLPGTFGLDSTNDIGSDTELRFASLASNGVVDASGKLVSREDFVKQTAGFTGTVDTVLTHRLDDGTEAIISAAIGKLYSGVGTMTERFSYAAGSQIVDVGGAKAGASTTGLANDATVYTASIIVDGGASQPIAVTGSTAQTYTTLLAQITADISGATVALVGGNLKFTSNTTGASSTIAITTGTLFTTLTGHVAVRTASAGTTTNNNWQFASLNGRIYCAQAGQALTCLNETTYAVESIVGQPWTSSPNCVISAYGRNWYADDAAGGNRFTVWWSDLLNGKAMTGGDAGSISLKNAWPQGQDSIVALAAAFGRFIIFGRNSVLMYTLPSDNDPATMTLTSVVGNIGCVARDSVVVADDGVYFLADNGIYRIDALAQVTALLTLPLMSALVNDEVISTYASETLTKVRAGYYPKEGWYVLNAPTANKCFVLHIRRKLPQLNVPVITTWTNASMPFRGFCVDKNGAWYCAGNDGVYKYTGYTSDGAPTTYTFDFYTPWINFGDESRLKHLKYVVFTFEAASGQTGTFRWQIDYKAGTVYTAPFTCDAVEFAEDPGMGVTKVHMGRSCNTAKFGFTMPVAGDKITLHQMLVFSQLGKTTSR